MIKFVPAVQTIICDRCWQQIDTEYFQVLSRLGSKSNDEDPLHFDFVNVRVSEFCAKCYAKIEDILNPNQKGK